MLNPAPKESNNEDLVQARDLFAKDKDCSTVQCVQNVENSLEHDTSVDAKWRALATAAATAVLNNEEPEFEPDDTASARVAVERIENLLKSALGVFTAMIEGAKSGAEVLSGDYLQGLSEIVQNADDVGATQVHFWLQPDALFVAHNGRPVRLRDIPALALPWNTTKRDDTKTIGRFGIGLTTLQALSKTLDLHSGPYDVRLGTPIVTAIQPFAVPEGLANIEDTIFRVPLLNNTLDPDRLLKWAETWDDSALLFCNSVSKIIIHASDHASLTLALQWEEQSSSWAAIGEVSTNMRRRRATAPDGRAWNVYTTEAVPPPGVHRTHKATGSSVPIGVALSLNCADKGQLYAGLPVVPLAHAVRVNAQFDPITGRQDLADTQWNARISALVADLWKAAVIDLFETNPPAAWRSIPLPKSSLRREAGAVARFEAILVMYAQEKLPELVTIQVGETRLPLTQLASEVPRLSSILSEKEIAELAQLPATLSFNARDQEGRWRKILDSWRESGVYLVPPVSVSAALKLLRRDGYSIQKTIALAAAALDEGLSYELFQVPCIMVRDGSRLRPPTRTDLWMFITSELPLAQEIGVAHVLHEAYITDEPDAQKVLSWLQERGAIINANDVTGVLRRLAVAGQAGERLEHPLTDLQLQAIRDAFEILSQSDREKLGPGVGKAIMIDGYQFDQDAKRIPLQASPASMYLPRRIDKEPDSFAVAAAKTLGLIWVSSRYANVLRSSQVRAGLGARSFLRLLGAETAPRLLPHPSLIQRYQNDPHRGLARFQLHAENPPGRVIALANMEATYTLEDQHCPDLIAVLMDISQDQKGTQRQSRASALLATIGRAWDRFSDAAKVTAANDYHGWQSRGTIKAFWVWQAASIPWLDDSKSNPTEPTDLRLQTSGTVAVYGPNAEGYLHRDLHQARHEILTLFGVAGEPNTSDLVARLQALRDSGTTDVAMLQSETAIIYQALADRLSGRVQVSGDLSISSLRQTFGSGKSLIWTNLGWQSSSQVLKGSPVFGDRRAFTPSVPSTARLWLELRVRTPNVADCIGVLREIAKDSDSPDGIQQTVILDTLRYLAAELSRRDNSADKSLSQKLAKLPLWTGEKWIRTRPIYAVDNPLLANGLRSQVAVWHPGGEMAQFKNLLAPLGVTDLSELSVSVVSNITAEVDEEATALLRAAVPLLYEDFARNDPKIGKSLRIPWEQLSLFDVRVTPNLQIEIADVPKIGSLTVPVHAFADPQTSIFYITKPTLMTSVEVGGQAIATLFAANQRNIAYAWLAACDIASSGGEALLLKLADDRRKEEEEKRAADIAARMAALQNEIQMAHSQQPAALAEASQDILASPHQPAISTQNAPRTQAPPKLRTLVDPGNYRLVNPRGSATGASNNVGSRIINANSREATPNLLPMPNYTGVSPNERTGPRSYTEIERESIGLEFVRRVFASDEQKIRDLRAQHGVGADAVDAFDRFYELKVYAGAEPDSITLEDSQIRRAMSTPNFFLVVVSELEGENASPKVRIIIDPLSQLSMSKTSSVIFTGVRSSTSVVYKFEL